MQTASNDTRAYSVSELVSLVKHSVGTLGSFTVTGEVSGFRGPQRSSGHCYFSIRDEHSAMDVIVWRNIYQASGIELADGLLIQMSGSFDVYDKSGKLSFVARHLELAGEGLLRQQVAALARKLEAEGLMDPTRKRPIPAFCSRVCMVTSLSGSVREDVRRTLLRRNPLVEIDIVGCMVQGQQAAQTIISALGYAAATKPDAILLVRGGGSFEDLMCFNDEGLARAIAACPVPVITGIGHEPDTSIADMVSDRRCSTPTAAAESVAPAMGELALAIDTQSSRLGRVLESFVSASQDRLTGLSQRLHMSALSELERRTHALEALASRPSLTNPLYLYERRMNDLAFSEQRLVDAISKNLDGASHTLELVYARLGAASLRILEPFRMKLSAATTALSALSPLEVLKRGYAIVRDTHNRVISDAASLGKDADVNVVLAKGEFSAHVTAVKLHSENSD